MEMKVQTLQARMRILSSVQEAEDTGELVKLLEKDLKGEQNTLPNTLLSRLRALRAVKSSIQTVGEKAESPEEVSRIRVRVHVRVIVCRNGSVVLELAAEHEKWAAWREPVEALLSAIQSSLAGIEGAKKQLARDAEKTQKNAMAAAKAQAKARAKGKDATVTTESAHKVFDLQLATHVEMAIGKTISDIADETKPFVLRATKCVLGLQMNNPTRVTMVILQAGFARSHQLVERRVFENTDIVRSDLLNTIKSDMQPCLAESLPGMKENMIVATKRGFEFIGFESKGLGCMKAVITDGSEIMVAAVPLVHLASYMADKGALSKSQPLKGLLGMFASVCAVYSVAGVAEVDMGTITHFFQSMTQAQADDLSLHCPLHVCTIKAADLLFVPAGWLYLEQVRSAVSGCVVCSVLRQAILVHVEQ
eukprot:6492212-Amphidinium_carterae.6